MSKLRFAIVLMLLVATTVPVFAAGGIKYWYYANSSFTGNPVGGRYTPDWDCPDDDLWWAWGTATAYRKVFLYDDCYEYGNVTEYCEVWNNGWSTVSCP